MRTGRLRHSAFAFICISMLPALVAAGLSGCALVETGKKLVPETEPVFEETTLQVKEDGTWAETIIEKMDQGYYDTSELKKLVDATVAEYNTAAGDGSVTVDEYTVGENGITLKMTYRNAETYADFNNVAAFDGSMLEAQMSGFLFLNDFKKVADGVSANEVISNEEPLSHKECQVLITDLSHVVSVPVKVKYVSANAVVEDWKTVRPAPADADGEGQNGLVLPSSAVYKEEKAASKITEEDREHSYVYIIYE